MIQAAHPLTVTRRCELLDVARSTVYYHPTGIPSEDLALMRLLDEIHLAGISIFAGPGWTPDTRESRSAHENRFHRTIVQVLRPSLSPR